MSASGPCPHSRSRLVPGCNVGLGIAVERLVGYAKLLQQVLPATARARQHVIV